MNNPKEKAKELLRKFQEQLFFQVTDERLYIMEAKGCALIAVDEIINSRPAITESQIEYNKFWNDVKSELQSF